MQSDAGMALPLWETVAQLPPPLPTGQGGLAAGLYVHVIDGLINLSNKGGSMQFAAGQFGFTPSFKQPPVVLPVNPGMQFARRRLCPRPRARTAPAPRPAKSRYRQLRSALTS